MAVFIKDPAGWDFLTRDPKGPFGRDMARRGRNVLSGAKKQVGVDTGDLRASLTSSVKYGSPIIVRVGSLNKIALMHHEGTKPHEITPKRAKVLRFNQNGVVRYAVRVWHPGTKPNRYLTDNLEKGLD